MNPHTPTLACIVLAHEDPRHVRRLLRALDPFPVFLHCDSRTSDEVYASMTEDLPARVTLLPRLRTGWARWENAEAEIAGYRAALAQTDASHFALLSGSDYPLASVEVIERTLVELAGLSTYQWYDLPHAEWGRSGGIARLRYPHWAVGKRMIRIPVPRRLPTDVRLVGGSQSKILARDHAAALLRVVDDRPELSRFWKRSWIADETFVHSLLGSPALVKGWRQQNVNTSLWYIRWDGDRAKSPAWLGPEDMPSVLGRRLYPDQPRDSLFGRKFSTDRSTALLDAIDAARSASQVESSA